MAWVEDILVEAFLNEREHAERADVSTLGWDFDRASGFFFHRSLGERFAESGGVFFDASDRQFYYFDSDSNMHERMDEEQLKCLRISAANAGVELPLADGEEAPADVALPVAKAAPTLLEAWQRPWDEWVDGGTGWLNLEFSFFADRSSLTVWAVARSSCQLFAFAAGTYEPRGSPALRLTPVGSVASKVVCASGAVVGSGPETEVQLPPESGANLRHCEIRYHPVEQCWQLKDLTSDSGSFVEGCRLPPGEWVNVESGKLHESGQRIRLGLQTLLLHSSENFQRFGKSPCSSRPAEINRCFEINPALLPPPPMCREQKVEVDNALRRSLANTKSSAEKSADALRTESYKDRSAHRRATRAEWSNLGSESGCIQTTSIDDMSGVEMQTETGTFPDGSFIGVGGNGRAGLGYDPGGKRQGARVSSEKEKRRKVTQERFDSSVATDA